MDVLLCCVWKAFAYKAQGNIASSITGLSKCVGSGSGQLRFLQKAELCIFNKR